MDSHESKIKMEEAVSPNHDLLRSNNSSDHVLNDFLRSFPLTATGFPHRVFTCSLFVFGHNLLGGTGPIGSLASAGSAARSYAFSGSILCMLETFLANLEGKEDFINSGVAGCYVGFMQSFFLGSKIPDVLNCCIWGVAGMVNFKIFCRPVPNTPKIVKNTVRPLPDSTIVSCIKIVAENVFMSSTLGFIIGRAFDPLREKGLIASFQDASSLTKFSAVAGGVLAYSFLLFRQLNGKDDDGIAVGSLGCATGLFIPQAYDTPNGLLLRCLGGGAVWLAITGILANGGPIFPHIPPTQKGIGGAGILHPFTLPLPKSVEDGFSAYHESLKKNIKKISRS